METRNCVERVPDDDITKQGRDDRRRSLQKCSCRFATTSRSATLSCSRDFGLRYGSVVRSTATALIRARNRSRPTVRSPLSPVGRIG
jgi:hypothetical protein